MCKGMVRHYGFSLAGRSHLAAGTVCQDSHITAPLPSGWVLAAVADGVGSAQRSNIGACLAVQTLAVFLAQQPIEESIAPLQELLQQGYACAMAAIVAKAKADGMPLHQYDTTLTAVLYNGKRAVFGQSGDGGLLALGEDGRYTLLTHVQKGEAYNQVYPLRSGEAYWQFSEAAGPFAGLLLLTDGLLDVAVPPLLAGQTQPLYTAFIHKLLNGSLPGLTLGALEEFSRQRQQWLQSEECAAITDDITAVALFRLGTQVAQPPPEYLKEPDWAALRQQRYYRLYPHLKPDGGNTDDCADE